MTAKQPGHRVPDDEWDAVVRNVPIVSVDLVVRVDDGVLLGKRENEPAKGEWFVPGGTVFKNERLREAVHRVAREELGSDVSIVRRLGTYQHFYDAAEADVDDGKHYLATAFVVTPEHASFEPDDQHEVFRVFEAPFPALHPYVDNYLDTIGVLAREPTEFGESV